MTVNELLNAWTQGLREGALTLPRCDDCSAWNWYPRTLCPACGCARRSMHEVRREGVVLTWTRVHRAVPPVQHLPVPYLIAVVELPDAGGVRVVCRAQEPDREPVKGEPVTLSIDETEGEPFLRFHYSSH